MSTPQTNTYWDYQRGILESFGTTLEEEGIPAAKKHLRSLTEIEDVDPRTYRECKKLLDEAEMDEGDPNDEFREFQQREAEERTRQMDEHFYPSEGPRY